MVAYSIAQRLTPNLALAGAGAAGALVALATLAIPYGALQDIVVTSGVAAFIPSAEPPLGATARICIGVFAGGAAALIAWFVLSGLLMWRDSRSEAEVGERPPAVRRADAHPDAPPRAPLLATRDLGMPFRARGERVDTISEKIEVDARVSLSEENGGDVGDLHLPVLPPEPVIAMGAPTPPVETIPTVSIPQVKVEAASPPTPQPLPADLDQPLSAFDPGAIPDLPRVPPPPLAPLTRAPALALGERLETFELRPPVRPALIPAPVAAPLPKADNLAAPETDASVNALLDRLERGIARRTHHAPEPAPVTQITSPAVPVPQAEPAPVPASPAPEPAREPLPTGLEGALAALRKMAVRA